jgi:D-alanine-D-alanine ligase
VGILLQHYKQPIMIEQFIGRDEITIGIVGNFPPTIIRVMLILPKTITEHSVYSIEVKRDYKNLVEYECPAMLTTETKDGFRHLA